MKKSLLTAKNGILFLFVMLLGQQALAEGTKQVSPASDKITALTLIPSRGSGSYYGASEANRFRFFISDPNEWVFCGFRWKTYVSSGTATDVTMYYRLYNGNGALVGNGALPTSGNGFISSYARAVRGPNGVDTVTNTGYTPTSFQISSFGTNFGAGEYSMEFYRSNDNGATQAPNDVWSTAPYFDFTIAKKVGNNFTSIPGRVFCRKWGFVAVNTDLLVTAASNAAPTLYSYSEDQTVVKIGFNEVFRPIAYDLAVNFYGVVKTGGTGNFPTDRRSINSVNSPEIPEGYRLFLNNPDPNTFSIKPISVLPTLANPAITGCSGTLTINYNMPAPGDARILLDLNGTTGYQENSADRIIEIFNANAGPGSVTWDGKNGFGVAVANTAIMKITAIYERGRFNLPLYDAEINKNGFQVESVAPIASTTTPLYWDDSTLLVNVTGSSDRNQDNNTGRGLNNIYKGQSSPAHAWNGNGNLTLAHPAPAVGNSETNSVQYDDFGNVRVINTWGWALQSSSDVANVAFGCFPVSGNVFHDANGLADGKVNQTGSVNTIPANTLYANIVSVDTFTDNDGVIYNTLTVRGVAAVNTDGTFSIPNVPNGKYYVVVSTTQGTVGSTNIPSPAVPTATTGGAWVNTGENFGLPTVNGNDGTVDGILSTSITVSNAAVTNANFGIQQKPVSTSITTTPQSNPGGNTKVTVPTLPGTDAEDGNYTGNNKIIIKTLPDPSKGILYYNNIPVTVGQEIPSYNPTLLTVDPVDGNTTLVFTYTHVDAAGVPSGTPGTATIEFKVVTITGSVWDDKNGNVIRETGEPTVSGNMTTTGSTVVSGNANLYVNLLNSAGVVLQTVPVSATGTYTFDKAPYNTNNLSLQLSSTPATLNSAAPGYTLGTNWVYLGEQIGSSNTALQTNVLGSIQLNTGSTAITAQDFAIEKRPTSDSKTVADQGNPGGNNKVVVPTLTGSDLEDGNYTGTTLTNKIVINTIPSATTGILYYNNVAVTGGQTIDNYDPAKLTVDPVDGNTTMVFTYTHIDAANQSSVATATVTMNFKVITVSGNIWEDKNANLLDDAAEPFVSGTTVGSSTAVTTGSNLYVNLINAEGKVIQSVQAAADGTYSLNMVPLATAGLKIQLSTVAGVVNSNQPATSKPRYWTSTGQSIGAGNSAAQTAGLSIINLTTGTTAITAQNFGMKQTGFCFVGRVYLEGALSSNGNLIADGRPVMRDNLRNSPFTFKNYIPANDPYSTATPYVNVISKYTKFPPQSNTPEYRRVTDSVSVFSVTGQNAIVDWIFVELRDKNNPTKVLATRSGLLQRDGDIVDVDGTNCLFFKDVPADNYFVAIRHRSHLGVMTKIAQTADQLQTMVDLTLVSTPVYDKGVNGPGGYNYTGLATNNNVKAGYRALWAGDFNADGKIKFDSPNDDRGVGLNQVVFYPTNTDLLTNYDFAYGYFQSDYNMNAKSKFDSPNDDQGFLLNTLNFYPNNAEILTNFDFFLQQLP